MLETGSISSEKSIVARALIAFFILFGSLFTLSGFYGLYYLNSKGDNSEQITEAIKNNLLTSIYYSENSVRFGTVNAIQNTLVSQSNYPFSRSEVLNRNDTEYRTILNINNAQWIAFRDNLKVQEGDILYRISTTYPESYNPDMTAFCINPSQPRSKICFLAVPL